jgi:hypothetical protein
MTGWYAERTPGRSPRVVIAAMLLALLLVAAVPVALLVGLVMMLLGHVVGGLALFGGSILAAVAAVTVAGMSGMHHLRKLITEHGFLRVFPLDGSQYTDGQYTDGQYTDGQYTDGQYTDGQYTDAAEPHGSKHAGVVHLDPGEYTEIR